MRILGKILATLGVLGLSTALAYGFIHSVWGNIGNYLYYLSSIRYGGEIGFFALAAGGCFLLIVLALIVLFLIYRIWIY